MTYSCENDNACCSANSSENKAILVAGATASGKSGLALEIAEKIGGEIVNADSMQVYADVPTLTARPTQAEMNGIKHRLYGFLPPDASFSAVKWVRAAKAELERIWRNGKTPIVVGGTGLYFQTLTNGISPVPETAPEIREKIRGEIEKIGFEKFAADFKRKDPAFAFTDPQRIVRAAEVLEQTGESITVWQKKPYQKQVDARFWSIFLNPERAELYNRCNERFLRMMDGAAVSEVEALLAKSPPRDSLIMKAIGVAEIAAMLNGEISKAQAVEHAQQMTRNYAKRQITWFSRRFHADFVVLNQKTDDILTNVLHFLG